MKTSLQYHHLKISGDRPEFVGFNKKGKMIDAKIKKNAYVLFKLNNVFLIEFDRRVEELLPIFDINHIMNKASIEYNENTETNTTIKASYCTYDEKFTKEKENSFKIDFETLLSALAFTMFNDNVIPIRAINKTTGEVNNLFDVVKPFAMIMNHKNDKKLINLRFDL